ncbi:MAG: cupredoxin domain-containing protein [Acidimicrobiales bacterium]
MTPRRSVVVSIVVIPLLLLAVACSSSKKGTTGATAAGSGGPTVVAKDIAYSPSTLAVKAGDTVTFANNDNTTHTFTADDKSFDSGRVDSGKSSTFVVPASATAGTKIAFHCEIHSSMKGTLTVG